jgi:hypothetical protein
MAIIYSKNRPFLQKNDRPGGPVKKYQSCAAAKPAIMPAGRAAPDPDSTDRASGP